MTDPKPETIATMYRVDEEAKSLFRSVHGSDRCSACGGHYSHFAGCQWVQSVIEGKTVNIPN